MDFEEVIHQAGFSTIDKFFKRVVAPVGIISFALFLGSLMLVQFWGIYLFTPPFSTMLYIVPFIILIVGLTAIVGLPYYILEKKKVNIHDNIHYFITFVGALSTMHVQRNSIFRYAAERTEFGEIARVIDRVYYLADFWNLGLVTTTRKLAGIVPSKILANFLDRLSAALDFGERLDIFLMEEQKAVMEEYATEYKASIQMLDLVQDALVSLTIGMAFVLSISFLLPMVSGYNPYLLVGLSGLLLVLIDVLAIIFIDSFITHDPLCHKLPIQPPEHHKMKQVTIPVLIGASLLMILLELLNIFDIPLNFSIAIAPFGLIGYYAYKCEEKAKNFDDAFPAFIRSIGGSLGARGGSLVGTIEPLRVHDFGIFNDPLEKLFRRLKVRCDKFLSWMYLSGETGSTLIENFGTIFLHILQLGGDAEAGAELISRNFTRLLGLRKLRLQLASSVRGVYYGTLFGITGAAYATLKMVEVLNDTMGKTLAAISDSPMVASVTQGLLPSLGQMNIPALENMLFFILVIHAAFCAIGIKMIDGGKKQTAFLDFIFMVWLVAVLSLILPWGFDQLFSMGSDASVGGLQPLPT